VFSGSACDNGLTLDGVLRHWGSSGVYPRVYPRREGLPLAAIRRTRAKFPARPVEDPPSRWISVDPASGRKPTLVTVWKGGSPVYFLSVRHEDHDQIADCIEGCGLVVLEGGGFVGASPSAALKLERVRGRFETWAKAKGIAYVEVTPDGWRGVLKIPARPRRRAELAGRAFIRTMAKSVGFACKATNDDKRASLLLGWACVQAWGWR